MYVENFNKANIFGGRSDDGFHKNSCAIELIGWNVKTLKRPKISFDI